MSIYRTQAIITKQSSSKEEFFSYIPIKSVDKSFLNLYCFICKSSRKITDNYFDFLFSYHRVIKYICLPEKRINIKGFFSKKKCPIGGCHAHYICNECNVHQVESLDELKMQTLIL